MRLSWIDYSEAHGRSAALTCRHFGISRQSLRLRSGQALDVRPLPGVTLKRFTARDVVCRWDVVEVRRRATAATATSFLEAVLERMSFPARALQASA